MTKTAAKRQAHQESHMYRQGSGWIVSTWDDSVKCNRLSCEMPYQEARQALSDWRLERVNQLLGIKTISYEWWE